MYYDTVAPGTVLVQGRLFINFIHQGYLRVLLEAARNKAWRDKLAPKSAHNPGEEYNLPASEAAIIGFVQDTNMEKLQLYQQGSTEMSARPDLKAPINITIQYGDASKYSGIPKKIIYDVDFITEGQEIQISGDPIQEVYEFIARRTT